MDVDERKREREKGGRNRKREKTEPDVSGAPVDQEGLKGVVKAATPKGEGKGRGKKDEKGEKIAVRPKIRMSMTRRTEPTRQPRSISWGFTDFSLPLFPPWFSPFIRRPLQALLIEPSRLIGARGFIGIYRWRTGGRAGLSRDFILFSRRRIDVGQASERDTPEERPCDARVSRFPSRGRRIGRILTRSRATTRRNARRGSIGAHAPPR